jgi:hypothetical protein
VELILGVIGIAVLILQWISNVLAAIPAHGWLFILGLFVFFRITTMIEQSEAKILQRFTDIEAKLREIEDEISELKNSYDEDDLDY